MTIKHTTDASYVSDTEKGTVLVDFYAPWCGPCKVIGPILEEVSEEIGDKIDVVKINIDENPKTPSELSVMGIPSLFLYKEGEIVEQHTGMAPKELLVQMINKHT